MADLDIDADDQAALLERAQVLAGHLEPRAGGAPEVEHSGARGDELVLLLYLDQLQQRGIEARRVRDWSKAERGEGERGRRSEAVLTLKAERAT